MTKHSHNTDYPLAAWERGPSAPCWPDFEPMRTYADEVAPSIHESFDPAGYARREKARMTHFRDHPKRTLPP